MPAIDPIILDLKVDMDKYLAGVRQATRTVDQHFGRQEARARMLEAQMRRSSGAIGTSIKGLAATFATYFTGRELVGLVDSFSRLQNQLKVAGLEGQRLADVQQRLYDLGTRYGVSVNALAELYGKSSQAGKELGATQEQLLALTEATSQSLLITGTSTEQASGAILGLTQALASGTVRAEEFNQINEGGLRPLLEAAAASDRFGGSVAKLRKAVTDGTVSSRELYEAILQNAELIAGKASQATLTLSGAFQTLRDQLAKYFGEAGQASGATAAMAEAIGALARNVETLIPALAIIATALGVGYVTNAIAARLATVALGTAAATTGRAMLAAFGGPVGLAITAIAVGLGYVVSESAKASAEAERLAKASAKNEAEFLGLAAAADKAGRETGELSDAQIIARSAALGLTIDTDKLADAHYRAAAAARIQRIEEQKLAVASAGREALKVANRLRNVGPGNAAFTSDPMDRKLGIRTSTGRFDNETGAAFLKSPEYKAFARAKATLEAMMGEPLDSFAPDAPAISGAAPGKPDKANAKRDTGPSAAEIATRQAREIASLNQEELRARAALTSNIYERADLERDILAAERDERIRRVGEDKDLDDQQKAAQIAYIKRLYGDPNSPGGDGEIVVTGNDSLYARQIMRELRDREIELANDALARQRDAIDAQASIATNLDDRDRLEHSALDLQQRIEQNLLEQDLANGRIADADQASALLAEKQLADRTALIRSQRSPLERYRDAMRESFDNIDTRIEEIQVEGLERLNDGIADAILGAKSLGEVFGNVADQIVRDLLRIAIQRSLIEPLANALLGPAGGGGGILGGIFGFLAALGGGARASGGPVNAGSPYIVGERGPELMVPRSAGFVVPNHKLGGAGAAGGTVRLIIEEAPGFAAKVRAEATGVAVEVTRASAPAIIDAAAGETSRRLSRPRM